MHSQSAGRTIAVFTFVAILFALFALPSSGQAAIIVALVGGLVAALALAGSFASRSLTAIPVRTRRR